MTREIAQLTLQIASGLFQHCINYGPFCFQLETIVSLYTKFAHILGIGRTSLPETFQILMLDATGRIFHTVLSDMLVKTQAC